VRPAINVGISVSRVGGNAQTPAMKKVAGKLRLDLAQYRELAAFAQFASDLDKTTRDQLTRGERLVEVLKQDQFVPMPFERQVMIIFAGTSGALDDVPAGSVKAFEDGFHAFMSEKHPDVGEKIRTSKKFDDETAKRLSTALEEHKKAFSASEKK
jgi:F-type H+-transporting ATPase subunit alpha